MNRWEGLKDRLYSVKDEIADFVLDNKCIA